MTITSIHRRLEVVVFAEFAERSEMTEKNNFMSLLFLLIFLQKYRQKSPFY